MKIKVLGLAVLALCAISLTPAAAQDKASGARKVLVKEKVEAGLIITETSKQNSEGKTTLGAGEQTADKIEAETEESEQTTEIVSVGADGQITGAKVSWLKFKKTKAEQDFGAPEMGKAVESKGDLEGAVVSWSYDAEKKAWTGKLEKGEESADMKKVLKKKEPFRVPFIPNKEVAVGETWEVPEAELRSFFADDETMKVKEIKAACKAEEITATKMGEYLKVSFTVDLKADMVNEQLNNPEVTGKISGHYLFDIGNSRCHSVEINMDMSFGGKVNTPQGAMDFTYKATAKETKSLSYTKKEGK